MGLLDSNIVKSVPSTQGWTSATSPTFTNNQTITINNPGGYRTLRIKLTLNGGSWDSAYIANQSSPAGIMLGDNGVILNRIEKAYGVVTIDANYSNVVLYAVTSDGIAGKTIGYEYLWDVNAPLSSDIKPVQLITKSQVTLATGTTSYTFRMLGSANVIDVTPFKYLFFVVQSKDGNTLKRLTYTVKMAISYKDFIGDNSTIRAYIKDALSVANGYMEKTEWLPVEGPLFGVSLSFDAANVVDGAVVNLLLYGVR